MIKQGYKEKKYSCLRVKKYINIKITTEAEITVIQTFRNYEHFNIFSFSLASNRILCCHDFEIQEVHG